MNQRDLFIFLYIKTNVFNKKLHIFLGGDKCNYICRKCLICYTSQNV